MIKAIQIIEIVAASIKLDLINQFIYELFRTITSKIPICNNNCDRTFFISPTFAITYINGT